MTGLVIVSLGPACSQGFNGNFWVRCEPGGARAWRATRKKPTIAESEIVRNNTKFMQTRYFPGLTRLAQPRPCLAQGATAFRFNDSCYAGIFGGSTRRLANAHCRR